MITREDVSTQQTHDVDGSFFGHDLCRRRYCGREMAHQELGVQLLQKVKAETDEIAKVESEPKLEGRQMVMVLAPK